MAKRTLTSLNRHYREVDGKIIRRVQVIPATPRVIMECKSCGRKHLVSEGQIKKCYHGGRYEESRRKRNQQTI